MKGNKSIILLGATFDTNNLGVSVLTSGAIRGMTGAIPGAEVVLLNFAKDSNSSFEYHTNDRTHTVHRLNMRFSKKLFLKNNIAVLLVLAMFLRLIPFASIRKRIAAKNAYLGALVGSDVIASIAGGDSLSDIYGLGQFLYVALPQVLAITLGREIVQLPQTFGPFNKSMTRAMARHIFRHSRMVYSRDYSGVDFVAALLGANRRAGRIKFAYDVGFILDPQEPEVAEPAVLAEAKSGDNVIAGMNVSGLLLRGGYTENNMFGLKVNYRDLILAIIDRLLSKPRTVVLLIPHVFGSGFESDVAGCQEIYASAKERYGDRLRVITGTYNQNEIKYIIGKCDVFLGSRMHACIGAISQHIPTVPIAYSNKFIGVMETVGMDRYVADPRSMDIGEILAVVDKAWAEQNMIRAHLEKKMPEVRERVLNLFKEIARELSLR